MKGVDVLGFPLILEPFRPLRSGWERAPVAWARAPGAVPYVIEKYYSRAHELQVITAIEVVQPDSEIVLTPRPEYHVSVTGLKWMAIAPYRVSESRGRFALREFGFDGYTQDNHVPDGLARNYWRPVDDKMVGEICRCVEREPAIRAMRGDYVWRG